MRTKRILIFVLILLLIFGFSEIITAEAKITEAQIKSKIYNTFFKDLQMAGIINTSPKNKTFIPANTIKMIAKEMKQITNIREFKSNAAVGGTFKKGYCLMFVHTKQTIKENYRFLGLLYSKDTGKMIARKFDIFPDFQEKELPKITVYEFKIPQKVNDYLKKYQAKLPKEGPFYYSWPHLPFNRVK